MYETVVRDYLLLGLRLGRLIDGFVDCWFGDPALSAQVDAEPLADPAALAAQAGELHAALANSGLHEERRAFLSAQVRALQCTARRLSGVDMPFQDEVRAYFGVEIRLGDTDRYAAVHQEIGVLLPGAGDLRARLAAFRERDRIPAGRLKPLAQAVSRALRDTVRTQFTLPGQEIVEYEAITDRPWNAFNRYYGDFRSRVTLNEGAGHGVSALPHLVTHEAYPGHHTEHCVKEAELVRARGHHEQVISLVNTPQCLVTEGMAELALAAVLGEGWGPWTAGVLAEHGLGLDGELVERLLPHTAQLLAVRQDAAILLHDRGFDVDHVVEYVQRWMLVEEERARHVVRFLTDPLWRAYTVTYIEGSRLVLRWLAARPAGEPIADRYRRLLVEPMLPATLLAESG